MANSPSAIKRVRTNKRREEINSARKSRIRTFIRKVEDSLKAGDKASAQAALNNAIPEIMRGVTKGVWHKNTASRKVSRLNARVNKLS